MNKRQKKKFIKKLHSQGKLIYRMGNKRIIAQVGIAEVLNKNRRVYTFDAMKEIMQMNNPININAKPWLRNPSLNIEDIINKEENIEWGI